ncbi:MAG TPA: TonB-dependent receptor [Saprospiraceae bacterium]|nr:TonB-dependent receptor [Saprospiraceae bacterium]
MMFLARILFLFLLLAYSPIKGQTIKVLDYTDRHPLIGAQITLLPGQQQVQTDILGQVQLPGEISFNAIRVSYWNYRSSQLSLEQLVHHRYEILLHASPVGLDEVVISANKMGTRRSDLPVQSLSIQSSAIEFENPSTSADLMGSTGEIAVQKSQQGGGSPILRGFEANKVLLVVDGVRMNNAIYRGGHLQNIITADASVMEKTEVIFGPASVLYGSDALGGVIHFMTKKPKLAISKPFEIRGNAQLKFATANREKAAQWQLNLGKKKWASFTGLSYSDYGDLRQGAVRNPFYGDWGKRKYYAARIDDRDTMLVNKRDNLQKSSGYRQYHLLQKFLWKPSDPVRHILNLQYSTSSDIPRYDRLNEVDGSGKLRHAQWYYGPQERLLAGYTYTRETHAKWADQLDITTAYQFIEESRHNRRFGNPMLQHRTEQLNIFSLNADLSKKIATHGIQYGGEFNFNALKSSAFQEDLILRTRSALDTRYPDGGSEMWSAGAYVAHQWKPNDRFVLHDGLRLNYTALNARFEDSLFFPFPFREIAQSNRSVNGSIGMVYKAFEHLHFTTHLSSGFRAPNIDDLAKIFESVTGQIVVPNPELKPEQVYNLDLGIQWQGNTLTEFGVSAYYTNYRNVITVQNSRFNGADSIWFDGVLSRVTTQANAAKAYLYGGQAKMNLEFNTQWSMNAVINYSYGRIATDSTDYPLDHIPPVFGKTALQFDHQKWKMECSVLYHGWKRLEDYNLIGEDNFQYATSEGSPSWWTLNVKASYAMHRNLQLQLALENIFDQYYRVFASGISAPGRNFMVSVRTVF